MRRLFWVALGATVGILVVRRVSRAAQSYTPEGVARSLSGIGDGLRDLPATVREGMAAREAELRAALGADATDLQAA